jgi:hypothetical protein
VGTSALLEARRQVDYGKLPVAPVVVIGSSLMRHAVPPLGDKVSGLLGDKRAHARMGINGITEAETVHVLDLVLKNGARTVFIEANALAFDFANGVPEVGWERVRPDVMMRALLSVSTLARESISKWLKPRPSTLLIDAKELDATFFVRPDDLVNLYPLRLRLPKDPKALEKVLKDANAAGVELILVAPPRSQLAADAMGIEANQTLQQHYQALALNMKLPLFYPATAWPDDHFIDTAHMNRRGRTRFMEELAQWYRQRP